MAMTEKQGGSDVRANTTTRGPSTAAGRRGVRAHRPQVVLLGADVRRVPGARPGRRRPVVLPRSRAVTPDGDAQPVPPPAAQGQARQPVQRLQRDRVRRHLGPDRSARRAAASRPSSRWSTTRGWTACSERHAACARRVEQATWHTAHRAAFGTHADRPAADAQRARRPVHRVRGRDGHGDAPGARLRRPRRRRARGAVQAPGDRRQQVLGVQARTGRTPARRSSAWAATATSRSRACPCSTARARSTASGRARATCICLDVLRALARSPASLEAFFDEIELAGGAEPRLDGVSRPSCARSSPISTRSRRARGGSSSAWRSRSRARCWSATPRPPSPTPSAPRGCTATAACAFGTLPPGTDFEAIIERHRPQV